MDIRFLCISFRLPNNYLAQYKLPPPTKRWSSVVMSDCSGHCRSLSGWSAISAMCSNKRTSSGCTLLQQTIIFVRLKQTHLETSCLPCLRRVEIISNQTFRPSVHPTVRLLFRSGLILLLPTKGLGPPLPGSATPRVRHSQDALVYLIYEHFVSTPYSFSQIPSRITLHEMKNNSCA